MMNDDDVSLTCIPGLGDNKQKPREYTIDFKVRSHFEKDIFNDYL